MALSVEKLLTDAHTLVIHLKEHDSLADSIIATTQTLFNKVEAMKQYQDDITELNEIAKHRPRSTLVLGIAQENRQIRELQQENRELQGALEEHQSALELIMQKYREHTVKLLQSNRLERAIQEREAVDKDSMCQLMDKIGEMASVMQKAIEVDETVGCADKERLSRLEMENRALREILEICTTSKERILAPELKPEEKKEEAEQEEEDDDDTDTECDSTILVGPEKKEPEEKDSEDKKKKKTPESGNKESPSRGGKESPSPGSGVKTVGGSKSSGDVKKGKPGVFGKVEGTTTVKKAASAVGLKKEAVKKSPSMEAKKDTTKGKPSPKIMGKK